MAKTSDSAPKPARWVDGDLLPAAGAAAASVVLLAASAGGHLAWTTALLLASLAWAAAAGVLAMRLRRRDAWLARERAQLATLEELQAQYGIAENLGAFGTWVIDRPRGRLVWSAGAFRLFGADPARGEPTLREFAESVHPEDRPRWIDAHRTAMKNGGEVRLEYRYLRAGRETIWIRSIGRAERDGSGQVQRIGGVAQDITGIRAMQQQLAASEAKFRDLTMMSSDWIWETDPAHHWSYFSESVDAVLGRWARAMLGRQPWDLPDSRFAFEQPDWQAQRVRMEAHSPFEDFEYALVDPHGQVHFVSISGRAVIDADGRFAGYRGVGRDITREKQQRLLLRLESEIASIMREQTEPERVITASIITLCGVLGWSGGANLVRLDARDGFTVRERWGYPAFTKVLAELPSELPMSGDCVEARAFSEGRSIWVPDMSQEPALAARYQARRLDARAAFIAPILDEAGAVMSVLLFLSPAGFRGDGFLDQVAEILSRNLSLYLQRKAAERRLTHQSLHDSLTNLPNRVFLTHQLEARLERGEPAAILYIDLDRFKLINDTLGHSIGDQVLIEVADRMKGAIRPHDIAGRIGGDEFILLLTAIDDRAEIERIARRVLTALEKPFVLQNRAYFLSGSIGVAIAPHDGRDARLLIKCADTAMYRVKSEGRNDVRFFAGDMSDERTEMLQLASELPLAMQRGDVELYYQPILDVAERRVAGFEALLRWRHPVRGMLLPDRFLPVAEQSNLIRELGLWSIRRALDDRVALGLDRYDDAAVSVNVSVRQLTEDGFLETLHRMLNERGMPARLLRLELTESAFIEHPERTVALIADLRRLGVRVIIDNFGTGYASLSYLKNLPVDGLKIDQVFVRDLPADRGNAAIIQAITTLAAKLGLQAMAEGVETAAELRALRSFDCDQVQGTLIAEPLPFAMLQEFLESLPEVRRMHMVQTIGRGG
jgi:diguanylate cyclase (GGDEF)-like protein/PAS domain S-box-containing protein